MSAVTRGADNAGNSQRQTRVLQSGACVAGHGDRSLSHHITEESIRSALGAGHTQDGEVDIVRTRGGSIAQDIEVTQSAGPVGTQSCGVELVEVVDERQAGR